MTFEVKMFVSVMCDVCKSVEKKYKCPLCGIFYCSLGCFKVHKEHSCTSSVSQSSQEDGHQEAVMDTLGEDSSMLFPTQNTVPLEKLKLLGQSEKMKELLTNKHLRDFLAFLDTSEDKAMLMRKAMREPLFLEFVDVCLETLNPEQRRNFTDEELLQAIQEKAEED